MNISRLFIIRPVMTTLLSISLVVVGIFAYHKLPVSNLPDVNYPTITVTASFPGASPEIMANTIATPLEKQFMTIPGINSVTSSNILGSTTIILGFDINRNIDLAAVDVDTAIRAVRPQLPPNLPQEPSFKKVNPSSTPIVYIAVTSSTMTRGQLYDYAFTFLGQRISILEGVSQVVVYGFPSAVRAQVDPGVVASLGISMQDVANAVSNENQYQPLGQLDGIFKTSQLYDNGALLKASEYDPVVVAYRDGSPVRLKDIANVVDSIQIDRGEQRYVDKEINQPSIILAVQQQPTANAVKVASSIHKLLASLESQLPGSVELKVVFDRSISIKESIFDVEMTLIIAFLLVVFVVFLYLGSPKDTIIPALVMPMSIVGTFVVIYLLRYTLDNLSLLALTLAIGFIIDDAIVVLENIVRHIEGGEKPYEASLNGSRQISFTIVSMTLSLIAVFIPLVFMAGLIGKLFQEFSITLTVVTVISGIISLTLTPMLCSRFLSPREKLLEHSDNAMSSFSIRFNAWMLGYYKHWLTWVFDHRKIVLSIGILSIVLSVYLYTLLPTDFIPDEDIGFLTAYTEAEEGTSSDQMARYHLQLIDILRDDPAISSMLSISSTPEYRQGLILISLAPKGNRKSSFDLIQDWNKKLNAVPGVNVYLVNVPLIDLNVGTQVRGMYQYFIQGLDQKELYAAADQLKKKLKNDPVFQAVSSDLENNSPQITMDIHRDPASTFGIDALNFEQALFLGFSGNRISRIQTPIGQYDVIVELNRDLQRNPSSLDYLYMHPGTGLSRTANTFNAAIPNPTFSTPANTTVEAPPSTTLTSPTNSPPGSAQPSIPLSNSGPIANTRPGNNKSVAESVAVSNSANSISVMSTPSGSARTALNNVDIGSIFVPLSGVSSWKEETGPASVNHFAQFQAVTFTFNIAPGVTLGHALQKLREHAGESFGDAVVGNLKGAAQTFEEAIKSILILLAVTVFTIYIVLGILYESFIHPLTILSTLPSAILGGLLTLYIFGMPLSIYAFLGIILLIGIVKKNGILMIDFALDNIRTKGESAEKSIFEACIVRFRPIMMTTAAAIMGAVPIALGFGAGAESRRPLGYVIIGGMLVSQLITLFLTPVVYLYFENMRERFSRAKPAINPPD